MSDGILSGWKTKEALGGVFLLGTVLWAGILRAEEPAPLPVAVPAGEAALHYAGRFDFADPQGPRCAWSGSAVTVRFTGTALQAEVRDAGHDFLQVFVDGKPTSAIELQPASALYPVVSGLSAGEHAVTLVKRTEFHLGVVQFLGFRLDDGGKALPAPAPTRRVEVIGDSISCGYGNEAAGKEERFSPATENGALAYGALAARACGADYVCVAWSGKKLWPNNSILDYYDRILPSLGDNGAILQVPPGTAWDFAAWQPDVVVINLGTNDFGMENPDGAGWTAAYRSLLTRLRAQYPKAAIYCTLGTMLGDMPPERKPASTIRGYLAALAAEFQAAGDPQVRFLDFGTQDPANGYGAGYHPSVKTDHAMADRLAAAWKKDLGW